MAVCNAGVVSFLNARPLWKFLAGRDGLTIMPSVPSGLARMLADGRCDIALLPVVDYWRARRRLTRVSNACIASDGETMTVRVFSKTPPERLERLQIDADSHTSVVLAQLLWLERYRRELELVPWRAARRESHPALGPPGLSGPGTASGRTKTSFEGVEAVLLIGDKVIGNAPEGYPFEIDLGAAWKELTGLPFVFAAWYGSKEKDHAAAARMLEEARDAGVAIAEQIAEEEAPQRGWPRDVAVRYLCEKMRYTLTEAMRAGMDRFFSMAYERGLL
ncbi:MAG TPA: menaquinone biosynthesis protein [Phycisphaerae bacterium]|nr:menaquinone biosynthesis protein [Phycisphaerae bacterium]